MNILINILHIAIGVVGFYFGFPFLAKVFVALNWFAVALSPLVLFLPSKKVFSSLEIWMSRATDIAAFLILVDQDMIVLAVLVAVQAVILEVAFAVRRGNNG